jgi:hypothetical protein
MNCSFDLKAYVLKEMDAVARSQVEAHADKCAGCREEIARLRLTCDALSVLREEEIPKRIAFVSDKIFEPKWWQAYLRPQFIGMALVAVAILAHALMRPVSDATIQTRVDEAVRVAVAESEKRQAETLAVALADYQMLSRQMVSFYKVSNRMEVGQ